MRGSKKEKVEIGRQIVRTVEQKNSTLKNIENVQQLLTRLTEQVEIYEVDDDIETKSLHTSVALGADHRAEKQVHMLQTQSERIQTDLTILTKQAKTLGMLDARTRQIRLLRAPHSNQFWSCVQMQTQGKIHNTALPLVHLYGRYRVHKVLSGHLQLPVYCVKFGLHGKVIITGSDDRLTKIWSASTGRLLHTLRGHSNNITDLAINGKQNMVASASEDKTIRVWEIETGFPIATLLGHSK